MEQHESAFEQDPDLKRLEGIANLLDNQFRIPGTNIRFGLDGIIGLIPYVGDVAGFVISGFFILIMVKKGAGPILMLRMLWNFVLDALIGLVPFFGDLADFGYKANFRNVRLLKNYYADGKAKPNAKGSLALLAFMFLLLLALLIWVIWKISSLAFTWVWNLFFGG